VPSQNRVGSKQRTNLFQHLAAQDLTLDCQPAPLVIIQQNAFRTEFLPEHLILGPEVIDHLLLLVVDPTRKDDEIELPRL